MAGLSHFFFGCVPLGGGSGFGVPGVFSEYSFRDATVTLGRVTGQGRETGTRLACVASVSP